MLKECVYEKTVTFTSSLDEGTFNKIMVEVNIKNELSIHTFGRCRLTDDELIELSDKLNELVQKKKLNLWG